MLRPRLQALIENAIKDETEYIVDKYGRGYYSEHEFFAVCEEELNEARDDINVILDTQKAIWKKVKANEDFTEELEKMKSFVICNMCELAQVGAVIERYRSGKQNNI